MPPPLEGAPVRAGILPALARLSCFPAGGASFPRPFLDPGSLASFIAAIRLARSRFLLRPFQSVLTLIMAMTTAPFFYCYLLKKIVTDAGLMLVF